MNTVGCVGVSTPMQMEVLFESRDTTLNSPKSSLRSPQQRQEQKDENCFCLSSTPSDGHSPFGLGEAKLQNRQKRNPKEKSISGTVLVVEEEAVPIAEVTQPRKIVHYYRKLGETLDSRVSQLCLLQQLHEQQWKATTETYWPEDHRASMLEQQALRYFDSEGKQPDVSTRKSFKQERDEDRNLFSKSKFRCLYCLGNHKNRQCNNFTCFRCCSFDHLGKDCKSAAELCAKCKRIGHSKSSCSVLCLKKPSLFRKQDLMRVQCMVCGELGHINCSKQRYSDQLYAQECPTGHGQYLSASQSIKLGDRRQIADLIEPEEDQPAASHSCKYSSRNRNELEVLKLNIQQNLKRQQEKLGSIRQPVVGQIDSKAVREELARRLKSRMEGFGGA